MSSKENDGDNLVNERHVLVSKFAEDSNTHCYHTLSVGSGNLCLSALSEYLIQNRSIDLDFIGYLLPLELGQMSFAVLSEN